MEPKFSVRSDGQRNHLTLYTVHCRLFADIIVATFDNYSSIVCCLNQQMIISYVWADQLWEKRGYKV